MERQGRLRRQWVEKGTAQGQMMFWDATLQKWVHTEITEAFWDDVNKRPTFSALILSSASSQLRIIDSDGSQEWRIGANSNLFLIEDENTGNIPFRIEDGAIHGLFQLTAASEAKILSSDGTDFIKVYHDGTQAWFETDDGPFKFIDTRLTNLNTTLDVIGNGTGHGVFRLDGNLIFQVVGWNLETMPFAGSNSRIFGEASEGRTKELIIGGFRTGDSLRFLEIGVGIDAVDTASFDGLSNYWFNGAIESEFTAPYFTLHNSTHEDTDGGRESRINFKGEQSGGEKTTLARIEVSHDGAADDEKGKIVLSTNDGSDADTPTEALTIDSARNIKASGNTISDSSGNLTSANGANFGPAGVTSITVLNGIVTAIS